MSRSPLDPHWRTRLASSSVPATPGRGWLRPLGDVVEPAVRLVCCPHAGGTADFFREWPRSFRSGIQVVAVQYPGHGDRLDDPCLTDVHELVSQLATELERLRPGTLVLFGHSFGAAVAYEAAARLSARGCPPRGVVISARVAPHLEQSGGGRLPSDAEIWTETVRLGGTPPEIAQDPEWRALLTPSLRADFHADATYRPTRTRLPCPMTVMVGKDDHDVPRRTSDSWREYTASGFAVRVLSGTHFYLVDHVPDIAAEVDRLASSSGPAGAPSAHAGETRPVPAIEPPAAGRVP